MGGETAADGDGDATRAAARVDGGSESTDAQESASRWRHLTRRSVTLLAAGAVAVGFGGWLIRPPPVSDSPGWETAADLPVARGELKAATFDGRVYAPGGLHGSGSVADRLDVYDPVDDAWAEVASMPVPLNHHGTAALGDRVYVVGGNERFSAPPGTAAFAYVPEADAWEQLPAMPDGRWGHELVAIDDRLYVVGGVTDEDDEVETYVFDPESLTWERAAPIPTPRDHVAAAAADGAVFVIGGRWDGELTDVVEAYDPDADAWEERASVPTARSGFGAAVVDGAIHAVGGENPAPVGGWTTDAHERYDPAADEWEALPDAPLSVHGNGVAASDGRLFVIGGAWRQGLQSVTAWSGYTFFFDPAEA